MGYKVHSVGTVPMLPSDFNEIAITAANIKQPGLLDVSSFSCIFNLFEMLEKLRSSTQPIGRVAWWARVELSLEKFRIWNRFNCLESV